jgi:uncharacterized protein
VSVRIGWIQIDRLCRLHGVRKLEVFGSILLIRSAVMSTCSWNSSHRRNSFSNFLDLKEALESLFGRRVDLVELRAIRNRRLRHHIEQSKSPVYAAA